MGSDSTLNLNITDGSTFTGSIGGNIKNAEGSSVSSEVGNVSVTLDSSSLWTLTSDTYIKSFSGSKKNVQLNGHKLYVNGKAL